MKKVLAIALALVMMFVFVSCGVINTNREETVDEATLKVEEYVEENKSELLSSMEEGFATSSGMTCTSSIETEGRGFIIQININEFDGLSEEMKTVLQETYDGLQGTFDSILEQMQTELPELEYFKILVCEKDGDELATIHAGK